MRHACLLADYVCLIFWAILLQEKCHLENCNALLAFEIIFIRQLKVKRARINATGNKKSLYVFPALTPRQGLTTRSFWEPVQFGQCLAYWGKCAVPQPEPCFNASLTQIMKFCSTMTKHILWYENTFPFAIKEVCRKHAHTRKETLYLMKFAVWLPNSYLLNSYLMCRGSNLLNAVRERKRESVTQTHDTKCFSAFSARLLWLMRGLVVATSIHPDSSYHLSIHR